MSSQKYLPSFNWMFECCICVFLLFELFINLQNFFYIKSASNLPYFNWMFLFQFANICYLNFSQQYLYERFSQVCSLGNNRTPNELSSASTPSDFSQQRGAIVKFEIKLSFICCINGLHASCSIDPYHCANTGSLCWSADILPILLSYLPLIPQNIDVTQYHGYECL